MNDVGCGACLGFSQQGLVNSLCGLSGGEHSWPKCLIVAALVPELTSEQGICSK